MVINTFRVTKYLCHSLKMLYLFIKNIYAETKSVLREINEYKLSLSHSHIVKNPFTFDMDIGHY